MHRPPLLTRLRTTLVAAGLAFGIAAASGLGGCGGACSHSGDREALIGGDFELVDHTGTAVTANTWPRQYKLIVFGFTTCPDVCPTELQAVSAALDRLGRRGVAVKPLFITIDPDRDDVPTVARYMENFHPAFSGLTGTPAQIAKAAGAYRVYYAKSHNNAPDGAPAEWYTMNHSAFIYLMDCDGHYIRHFDHNVGPDELAAALRALL